MTALIQGHWETDDIIQVLISSDAGNTWSVLHTWDSSQSITNTSNDFLISLNGYVSPTTMFAIYGSSTLANADTEFFIDNFTVETIPTCFPVSGVVFGSANSNSVPVSWNAPSQIPSNGYQIYFSTVNAAPTTSTVLDATNSINSTTNSATISGLSANTTYYVWVRSDCGAGDFSIWKSGNSFTTICASTNIPYSLDFGTGATMPACTSLENAGTGNNWTIVSPVTGYTGSVLQYSYHSNNAANAWFYTQGLNLVAGTKYYITYKYGNNSASFTEKMKVAVGNSATSSAMTTVLADYPNISANTPYNGSTTFTPSVHGIHYFGFNAYSDADEYYLYLDDIMISDQTGAIIWDGAQWSNVSGPTSNTPALIDGNYTGGSISAADLTISSGVNVVMNGELNAANISNNGNLVIGQNGTMMYTGSFANSGSGTFAVEKNVTAAAVNQYSFWSSPVASQSMFTIFDAGTPQFVTDYAPATNTWIAVASPANSVRGKGYSVKTPAGATLAKFEGLPNHGSFTTTITAPNASAANYVLLGNPYPSLLSLQTLTTVNSTKLNGNYWLWDKAAENYATYNAGSDTYVPAPSSSVTLTGGTVQPAQGFLAEAVSGSTSVAFNNTMRSTGSTGYLNKSAASSGQGKFWLKLNASATQFSTMAITYGYGDDGRESTDSKSLSSTPNELLSILSGEKLIIQGRGAFDDQDAIVLAVKLAADAQYNIALSQTEGVFANGQEVILHDKLMNIYHNLSKGIYTFQGTAGEHEGRFTILYRKAVQLTAVTEVSIAKNGEVFTVTSPEPIRMVEVYDTAGRLVKKVQGGGTTVDVSISARGAYVVNIVTVKETVSNKVVK